MMRPVAFRLVNLWLVLFFLLTLVATVRSVTGYRGPMDNTANTPTYFTLALLCYMGLLAYVLLGVFQLRVAPIAICLALLIWWFLSIAVRFASVSPSNSPDARTKTFVAILVLLNALSTWYLVRPRFWAFRKRFRNEKDIEATRRFAEKQIKRSVRG